MKASGIYSTPSGFRVVACIGRGPGKRQEKRFPAGTAARVMARWQQDTCAALRATAADQAKPSSILNDLETAYLPAIVAMPTRATRERHLRMWCAALGAGRGRETVTPADIRAVLARQQVAGWSKASCNRFRTALMSFYTVLNGKSGENPVRDVAKHREKKRPPKPLDYATFESILAAMPDKGRGDTGGTRPTVNKTKARLRLIAYTGLPHAQIMRLKSGQIRWAERLVYIEGRDKGDGTDDLWLPLSNAGMAALAAFAAADAWGPFSTASMRKNFRVAARKTGREDLTPYDLRHLFGSTVLGLTRNRAATRDLMLHTTDQTTARYTQAAIPTELRAAVREFDAKVVGSGFGRWRDAALKTDGSS
jgi:integrase